MGMNGLRKRMWLLLILPGAFFVTVFMLIPLFSILLSTFFPENRFSMDNYVRLVQSIVFPAGLCTACGSGLLGTFLCTVLGFPVLIHQSLFQDGRTDDGYNPVFPMFPVSHPRSFGYGWSSWAVKEL